MKGSRVLKETEIKKILKYLKRTNYRNYIGVRLSLTFGLRVQELLNLKFDDFQNDFVTIKSLKKSNDQKFPIPKKLKNEIAKLKSYYKDNKIEFSSKSSILISKKKCVLTRQQFNLIIRNTCLHLEIKGKVSNHSFRKTLITRVYKETNQDIILTKLYSRHKNINSLLPYIEIQKEPTLIKQLIW